MTPTECPKSRFLGHPIRVTHVICDVGRKAQKTWQV
jgi:hypothetical protein